MGCEGQRGRGRALLPPSQTGPGLRGRCRGPPWNPPEAQDCTLPRQHPGMEGLLDVSERSRPMACLPDRPEGPNRGEAVTWSTWVSFGGDCQMFGVSRVGPRQS
ncbi:uncharacterized protein LOC143169782 isoform X2 [Aptenodytes patagonicus]|uniref:uncharacterized protein LOC143169782 isoform X2 n=1 Tax=Aptenodytes patagonicus TaxID=9234 RepID=UPI003F9F7528